MVHGERNRRGTIVFTCRVGEETRGGSAEVPAWMFDEAVCRIFQPGP